MSFDFKKLGMDRMATDIAKSVQPVSTRPKTGDITAGSLVSVKIGIVGTPGPLGQTTVQVRPTAAIPAANPTAQIIKTWYIEGSTLYVEMNGNLSGESVSFWVF